MAAPENIEGPDLTLGIDLAAIPRGAMIAGRVGDEPVLLSWQGDRLHAVGGRCTHYGALLARGLAGDGTIRCPLHHACFSLATGAALRAPAFDPLGRWQVEIEQGSAFVRRRLEEPAAPPSPTAAAGIGTIVIAGGGGAGFACAQELRRLGHAGRIVMVSEEPNSPVDRPNLSKDYLAGTAPADWLPLRAADHYRDAGIELQLGTSAVALDPGQRILWIEQGDGARRALPFDRLLIATGSEPRAMPVPGFELDTVFTLRTPSDADAIAARAGTSGHCVIFGSSFIGLEAAAALRARGLDVTIVSLDTKPFEKTLGREVGRFFLQLHERNGVAFRLGRTAHGFDGDTLILDDGTRVPADFVILGIGVRPRLALAMTAGLADAGAVPVDDRLETAAPGIFAAGDIAAWPGPSGARIRIEHWVTALRQGQAAATNMLGLDRRFAHVPFFWTEQYGRSLRYVGHAPDWTRVEIDGDVASGAFIARYYRGPLLRASASVGRDRDNLEDERALEASIGVAGCAAETARQTPRLIQAI